MSEILLKRIWNPKAAAIWSLFISPLFGIFIHWRNWKALGENSKARNSLLWLLGAIATFIVVQILELDLSYRYATRIVSLIYLFVWYELSGKSQVGLYTSMPQEQYQKRSLILPLIIYAAFFLGCILIAENASKIGDRIEKASYVGQPPECNSQEMKDSIENVIETSGTDKSINVKVLDIGTVKEIRFFPESKMRICKTNVAINTGREDIYVQIYPNSDQTDFLIEIATDYYSLSTPPLVKSQNQ